MNELIQYFTALEARIATLESQLANNSGDDRQVQEQIVTLESRLQEAETRLQEAETRIAELETCLQRSDSTEGTDPQKVSQNEVGDAKGLSQMCESEALENSEPEIEVELVFNDEPEPEISSEAISSVVDAISSPVGTNSSVEDTISSDEVAISSAEGTSSAAKGGLASVSDLRKAISLGDRFLFVKELFGGEGEKLQIVIDELNKLNSLAEANAWIDKRFHWDKESKAYELFQNALTRRFA